MQASYPQTNAELYELARASLPGGISHELRFRAPNPLYITKAYGALKWDIEGREYIDFKMGSASQMLGHSHPDVVHAVQDQMARNAFSADCHTIEIDWASRINSLFPSADQTRFTASGTEATMLALRLGRAFSKRSEILRIDGHYHGWHDHVLKGAKAGSNKPPSLGIPEDINALIHPVPANLELISENLSNNQEIGTIIVEASGANYGSVPLPKDFLKGLRHLADAFECVLIFDEIITGFRWSPGGLQARDGIVPDLTTLAKILTGGLPGGAVCGRKDILSLLDPLNPIDGMAPAVSHKGTFNASPLIAAGAVAAMEHLQTGKPQAQADAMAERLRIGLRAILKDHDISGAIYGESSTFHIYLGPCDGTVNSLSPSVIRAIPKPCVQALQQGLNARGVDLMSHTSGVLSSAHNEALVDQALTAFDACFKDLQSKGLLPS